MKNVTLIIATLKVHFILITGGKNLKKCGWGKYWFGWIIGLKEQSYPATTKGLKSKVFHMAFEANDIKNKFLIAHLLVDRMVVDCSCKFDKYLCFSFRLNQVPSNVPRRFRPKVIKLSSQLNDKILLNFNKYCYVLTIFAKLNAFVKKIIISSFSVQFDCCNFFLK